MVDPVWIVLADGTRLCARVWLPVDAARAPVPAILEYLPYRKDDVTAADDEARRERHDGLQHHIDGPAAANAALRP